MCSKHSAHFAAYHRCRIDPYVVYRGYVRESLKHSDAFSCSPGYVRVSALACVVKYCQRSPGKTLTNTESSPVNGVQGHKVGMERVKAPVRQKIDIYLCTMFTIREHTHTHTSIFTGKQSMISFPASSHRSTVLE